MIEDGREYPSKFVWYQCRETYQNSQALSHKPSEAEFQDIEKVIYKQLFIMLLSSKINFKRISFFLNSRRFCDFFDVPRGERVPLINTKT